MRISHRHRFVFFSSPRTGSTSVRNYLTPLSDFCGAVRPTPGQPFHDHMRPFDARQAFASLGWDYDSYYKFVFVRNPWSRLASVYALIRALERNFDQPFLAWLETVKPYGPGGGGDGTIMETYRQFGTYSLAAFAGDGSGALFVDDVFRLEDIEKVPQLLRKRGIPIDPNMTVGVDNRTGGTIDYRRLYTTRRSIELVGDLYADDIRRFRYSFPSPRG